MKKRPNLLNLLTLLIVGLLVAGGLVWEFYGQNLLLRIYEGRFHSAVDDLVRQHRNLDPAVRTAAFYSDLASTFLARIAVLVLVTLALLWLAWPHFKKRVTAFRAEPVAPEQLAVFRLLVFGVLLLYPNYTAIFRMSALPPALLVAPPGWEFILSWLPPSPLLAKISGSLFVLGCLGALVGYYTRWMALLATLSGIYFLGIPQFYGKIDHYHHLLWFSALAAFGPVSDRWSFDAWRKPQQIVRPAAHYARTFHLIVVLIALIYFFAGWWKIIGGGMAWIWGDGAWLHLETQAMRLGRELPSWLVQNDWLQRLLGLATVVLELGWAYLVLSRRFRPWILAVALFFHGSIYWLMDINFWQLPVFYLIFLPWGELLGQKSAKMQHLITRRQTGLRWIGGLLIVGNGLCGLAHVDSWPFAVYPSFGNPPERRVMHYYLVGSDRTSIVNINLESDPRLRLWLPKTRLQGLHKQLIQSSDSVFTAKLELLLPLYIGALAPESERNYTVMLRVIDLENTEVLVNKVVAHSNSRGEIHWAD